MLTPTTLWDLIKPIIGLRPAPAPARARPAEASPGPKPSSRPRRQRLGEPTRPRAVDRYEAIARELLTTHNIRVRKWRKNSSGVAVVLRYRDGTIRKYVETPRPRGPMSMAIFLHEIGHHVLGVGSISPRCLEEYEAWMFALREMETRGLNITDAVRRRVDKSLRYAVRKAQRRGLRDLPAQLLPYVTTR